MAKGLAGQACSFLRRLLSSYRTQQNRSHDYSKLYLQAYAKCPCVKASGVLGILISRALYVGLSMFVPNCFWLCPLLEVLVAVKLKDYETNTMVETQLREVLCVTPVLLFFWRR